MPGIGMEIAHQLGEDQAAERLKGFLERVRQSYESQVSNLSESWDGNILSFAFTTYGFNIKGTVAVTPETVQFNGELPFAAMMFKGKIEQSIRNELEKVLA